MILRKISLIISIGAFPVIAWSVINTDVSSYTDPAKTESVEIKTIQPRLYQEIQRYILPAELEAAESVEIYARANGYIKKRFVDIGSEVEKGQILALLSSPELEDQINQAKANIRKQKSVVELTRRLSQRYERLQATGVVSVVDVEEKISDFEVAKATLINYQARLEQLNEEYAYTEIRAPFSGVITKRFAEIGQRVTASDQNPLFSLNWQNELKAVVYIPQSMLNKIDVKNQATLSIHGMEAGSDDLIYLRQSKTLSSNGSMRVEFLVKNGQLTPGMTGDLSLSSVSEGDSYVLPLNTIRMVNGKPMIHTLKDNNVSTLPVKIETFLTNDVRVSGNLLQTQQVIINPNALLEIN